MNNITITLTAEQARAVRRAIAAEIVKGAGTFLTPAAVAALGDTVEQIHRAGLSVEDTEQLNRVAHNLEVRLNFAG